MFVSISSRSYRLFVPFIFIDWQKRMFLFQETKTRLELAGNLVLEGVELLDELLAGVLEEHVPVHEPGRVAEADELHHLGELSRRKETGGERRKEM